MLSYYESKREFAEKLTRATSLSVAVLEPTAETFHKPRSYSEDFEITPLFSLDKFITSCNQVLFNLTISGNIELEFLARDVLCKSLSSERNKEEIEAFTGFLEQLKLSPSSWLILFNTSDISPKFTIAIAKKLLEIPKDTFIAFNKLINILDFVENNKHTKNNKLLTQIQIYAKTDRASANINPLVHFCQNFSHDAGFLKFVVGIYLDRFGKRQKKGSSAVLFEPDVTSGKQTYLHVLFAEDDLGCDKISSLLSAILAMDSAFAVKNSVHFITALFCHDDNGITPLMLLEDKGEKWDAIRVQIETLALRFVKTFIGISQAQWDKCFADKLDVFGNNLAKNKVMSLFEAEEIARMAELIEYRFDIRIAVRDILRKSNLYTKYNEVRLGLLFGADEYTTLKAVNGNKLRYEICVALSKYIVDTDTNPHSAMKVQELKFLHTLDSFKTSMRASPVTETVVWRIICNYFNDGMIDDEKLNNLILVLANQSAFFGFDFNLDADGATPLVDAALIMQSLTLVKALIERFKAKVPPALLLDLACEPAFIDKGIFQYIYLSYLEARGTNHSAALPAPHSITKGGAMHGGKFDIATLLVISGKRPAALRFVLEHKDKQNPKNNYNPYILDDHGNNLVQQVLACVFSQYRNVELDPELGLEFIRLLLENDKHAKFFVEQKNKHNFTPLSSVLMITNKFSDQYICDLITLLIEKGSRLDEKIDFDANLLHASLHNLSLKGLECLLEHMQKNLTDTKFKDILNGRNNVGITPLNVTDNLSRLLPVSASEVRKLYADKKSLLARYGAQLASELPTITPPSASVINQNAKTVRNRMKM